MDWSQQSIDRGWAWLVMATCYLGMTSLSVTIFGNGVIYVALLEKFNQGSTMTSLVSAVSSGLMCFAAPLAGIIMKKYSCRVAVIGGGVLTTLGYSLSTCAPNLEWMIVTAGVLVGLGSSACTSGMACGIAFYFNKFRHYMMSIFLVLPGIALFLGTPFAQLLISKMGLSDTFFVYGSISFQLCLVGALLRPSVLELKERTTIKMIEKNANRKMCNVVAKLVDQGILPLKDFLLFLISTITWNFAHSFTVSHLPNYIVTHGAKEILVNDVMMVFSIANIIGRLLGVFTAGRWNSSAIFIHSFSLGVAGILTLTFPFYSHVLCGIYIYSFQSGLAVGWTNTMMTVIALDFVGVSRLSESFVLVLLFCGIGMIFGPVVSGYLYSVYGTYDPSFICTGLILLVGSACGFLSRLLKNQQRHGENDDINQCKEQFLIDG